ncbi:hypothetical protein NH340_JMT00470 [Sarcoptes scabiei]|nr:hypothetical protein NH340_JMT00470 [Sarcoptes scabiei]
MPGIFDSNQNAKEIDHNNLETNICVFNQNCLAETLSSSEPSTFSTASILGTNDRFLSQTSSIDHSLVERSSSPNVLIFEKAPNLLPSNDDGYDSASQKQITTDESSLDDELENYENHHKNRSDAVVIPKLNRNQSFPVDIKRSKTIRGILKYPVGWPRRALSESESDGIIDVPLSIDLASLWIANSPGHSNNFLSKSVQYSFDSDAIDQDLDDLDRPKKCVTFADKQATYVFRPNSSILGRRQKNQKKAKKKKERELKKLGTSPSEEISFDVNVRERHTEIMYDYEDDFSSSNELSTSETSGCETSSASECSADEAVIGEEEPIILYKEESEYRQSPSNILIDSNQKNSNNKIKRKNCRKKNRKNKQSMRTFLETGGYDSD